MVSRLRLCGMLRPHTPPQRLSLTLTRSSHRYTVPQLPVTGSASLVLVGLGICAFIVDTQPLHNEGTGPLARPDMAQQDPLDALGPDALNRSTLHLVHRSLGELIRLYVTFTASSSSLLVDTTSSIIHALEGIRRVLPLGLGELPWSLARFVIRRTAFATFAGGEDATGTYPLLERLGREGCSGLLCYSAEAEEASAGGGGNILTANLEETLRAIAAAGKFPLDRPAMSVRPTWVAIKVTGLVRDPAVLERASTALTSSSAFQRGQRAPSEPLFPPSPSLTDGDEATLAELHDGLQRCAALARELGVRIDIDAEQSWFQPAIDRFYQKLAESQNTVCAGRSLPIIFQTYQCYRSDAQGRLRSDLAWATSNGFAFGAKLVRGAYVESENARAQRLRRPSPLWSDKASTDRCYDACARAMTDEIIRQADSAHIGVMFASHNAKSTRDVLERFRSAGLVRNNGASLIVDERLRGRIVFGQLLGMADNLTAALTNLLGRTAPLEVDAGKRAEASLPYVLKYIPYGHVDKVVPYLLRRAQENKAILAGDNSRGGVRHERRAVGREIRRRLLRRPADASLEYNTRH